jgi:ferritin-like metal-binding protein YciE
MTPERRYLAALLRDAHVMEGQAMTLLQTQIRRCLHHAAPGPSSVAATCPEA